jgi:peptide/nickel transport system substrate-binding protein
MNPRGLRIAAVVVAVLTIVAAVSAYYGFSRSAAAAASCSLSSTTSVIIDQPEKPDSLDPAYVSTTPGWAIVQQVYQTLVMYNGSQVGPPTSTSGLGVNPSGSPGSWVAPLLASNWTESADGIHWNFTMFPNEYFANGDPLNAYVMWYSLYWNLVVNQPLVFLLEENFFLPGQTWYNISTSGFSNATSVASFQATDNWMTALLNQLDSSKSNLLNPPASILSAMTADNQSFRVINKTTIQFNLLGAGYLDSGYPFVPTPYFFFLDQVATPAFAAIDPLEVAAHGGVVENTENTWFANNMMGSGPFQLSFWDPSTGYTLIPSPNYWAASFANSSKWAWDNNLQPAKTTIQIAFQEEPTVVVSNLKTGAAATASFAYIGPSLINLLKSDPCLTVSALPATYGAVSFSGWIFMDQNSPNNFNYAPIPLSVDPFQNQSVRAAVVHAINYQQIISTAFGGYATQWVGPVPPGYPFYNPDHLSNYSYDLSLAKAEIANSPCSGGCTVNFEYLNTGDWVQVASLIASDLSAIGITLKLVPMSIDQLIVEQTYTASGTCPTQTSAYGGPFYIGMDYYTADYVAPDDATQLNAATGGFYNGCMSEFSNATMDSWVYTAAATLNPSVAAQLYANMTNFMYWNYTNAWLVVPTAFSVTSNHLTGVVPNPMGSAIPFEMQYNKVAVTS